MHRLESPILPVDIKSSPTLRRVSHPESHRLIGGTLCLDFANTVNGHGDLPLNEYLCDYRDLVLWSRHAGLLDESQARSLLLEAEQHFDAAAGAYRKAIGLRELIYRIFSCITSGNSPDSKDLDSLCLLRLEVLRHSRLKGHGIGFKWIWEYGPSLDRMLWPVIITSFDLLTSIEIGHVKKCSGEHCDWLFVDGSRNHLRRWCSMDACGNRFKMRRRYSRRTKVY